MADEKGSPKLHSHCEVVTFRTAWKMAQVAHEMGAHLNLVAYPGEHYHIPDFERPLRRIGIVDTIRPGNVAVRLSGYFPGGVTTEFYDRVESVRPRADQPPAETV